MSFWQSYISLWSRGRGNADPPPPATGSRDGVAADVDDTLWQWTVGSDALGWRDITDEVGLSGVYSNVRPGGAASCSFTVPADVWSRGYNELQPDRQVVVRYAGQTVWDGYLLPRPINYKGE